MFNHILYATDGSDHSRKAVAYVNEVARLTNAKVTVLHAYHPLSDLEYLLSGAEYDRAFHHRVKGAGQIIEEAASALTAEGIEIEQDLAVGPPAEAILRAADARKCDLIIMGARGLSDLQGLLLGSVSHKVIHHAECPVMIVR